MNDKIKIVDARMGRGKTSAAIRYMSDHPDRRFLFVTPYLSEVERVCDMCDFDEPNGDERTKLSDLRMLMSAGRNVAATHSLFECITDDVLDLAKEKHYTLIIDESINVIWRVNITDKDYKLILRVLAHEDDDGRIVWDDEEYTGKFDGYKQLADCGQLYKVDSSFIGIMRPDMLTSFDEVIMMTYMFNGQYQRAYLDCFGFQYSMYGIDSSGEFRFVEGTDSPPPMDYKSLIHIVDDDDMNAVGDDYYALGKAWFERRNKSDKDIKKIRSNMNKFFRRITKSTSKERLWTTFKSAADMIDIDGGRFRNAFLQLSAKATNAYRECNAVAYIINRFADPNIAKFFTARGIHLDNDDFALSEMLQFIWRSAIRDGKPITVYIPSKRMRELLIGWIERNSIGGDNADE